MSKKVSKLSGFSVQLPLAIRTGKYIVGFNKVLMSIMKKQSKYVIITANLPKMMRNRIEYYCVLANNIPVKFYEGTNNELSALCGLRCRASVISVLDQGEAELIGLDQ